MSKIDTVALAPSDVDRFVFGSYLTDDILEVVGKLSLYTSSQGLLSNEERIETAVSE